MPTPRPRTRRAGRRGATRAIILVVSSLALLSWLAYLHEPTRARIAGLLESVEIIDLVTDVDQHRSWSPDQLLDLGSPESREQMLDGWSHGTREIRNSPISSEGTGAWSLGDEASLEVFALADQDLALRFRCTPAGPVETRPSLIRMSVNGAPWRSFKLKRSMRTYRATIPGELLRDGSNLLRIEHEPSLDELPGSMATTARALWDYVETKLSAPEEGSGAAEQPDTLAHPVDPAATQGSTVSAASIPGEAPEVSLLIRQGSGMDLYLDIEKGTVLEIDGIEPANATVRLTWTPLHSELPYVSELLSGAGPKLIRLSETSRASGKLSLTALVGDHLPSIDRSGIDDAQAARIEVAVGHPRLVHRVTGARALLGLLHREPSPRRRPAASSGDADRPSIVVYLIDTLRADHMGCYGYQRPTTPNIDRFAANAVVFENAQAQSPWTRPSVASILTGLLPQTHGAVDREDRLPEAALTVAEQLRDGGYHTVAVVANGNTHGPFGFAQGFDEFIYLPDMAPSQVVHQEVVAALDRRPIEKPLFLWIHTIDPHAPYDPPEPFRSLLAPGQSNAAAGSLERLTELRLLGSLVDPADVERMIDLYDGEIASNDASFGELLYQLRLRDLHDDALLVVLSDHGEEFMDHGGWAHGKTLYAEMLDVPLIIKPPRWRSGARRIRALARHIDIAPTLLAYGGCATGHTGHGQSLHVLLSGDRAPSDWDDTSIAHLHLDRREASSLVGDRFKVILPRWDGSAGYPRVYDRAVDPGEDQDLALRYQALAHHLAGTLETTEANLESSLPGERLDLSAEPEIEEQLRALGYIE